MPDQPVAPATSDDSSSLEATPRSPSPSGVEVRLDDSNVPALYANICRVTTTPEELILDLTLDPNPLRPGPKTIPISQRVILNPYTAKRLTALLSEAIRHHEKQFGTLETDVRKRRKDA